MHHLNLEAEDPPRLEIAIHPATEDAQPRRANCRHLQRHRANPLQKQPKPLVSLYKQCIESQNKGMAMSETTFNIVTNPLKIRQLNAKLAKIISARFPFKQSRELTYPAGHHTGRVYFEEEYGTRVRGWSPKDSDAKKHVNHL